MLFVCLPVTDNKFPTAVRKLKMQQKKMQILSTAPPNALNAFGCHIFKRHLINNTATPAA